MKLAEELAGHESKLNTYIIHEFNSLKKTNIVTNNIVEKKIDAVIAIKYTGDFHGLLSNYFKLPEIAFYANTVINGLDSSFAYDGNRDIKLLKPETFESIYRFMKQKSAIK